VAASLLPSACEQLELSVIKFSVGLLAENFIERVAGRIVCYLYGSSAKIAVSIRFSTFEQMAIRQINSDPSA
jgi:chromosome condensin MukBEF MukE localization factor